MGKARINKEQAVISPEVERLIAEYRRAYPGVKTFYVATDRQVFLQREEKTARAHQRSIGKETELQIIK